MQPQPVTDLIIYKLEGIGPTRKVAFITPRSISLADDTDSFFM